MDETPDLVLNDKLKSEKVKQILKRLIVSSNDIERIKAIFLSEMELALNMKPSSLQMENTYIPELPDGSENGVFLALDLGGTNFRTLLMEFKDGVVTNEIVQHFHISDNLRVGSGEALFAYLAHCIDQFAISQKLLDHLTYPLGFTFSFPMRQNALDCGILITWTKSFNCPSAVGQDAVKILKDCLHKQGRKNINIVAILNDTTGTLVHGAMKDRRTRIGIVLGTGTNACYMESADKVKNWQLRQQEKHVIIDIEWGAFGDNGVLNFIRTTFDDLVDENSLLKGSFTFEKYIGGKYLGELVRVILTELRKEKLFLVNTPINKFPAPWSFGSDNVSAVETGTVMNSLEQAQAVLAQRFGCHINEIVADDLEILKYVCGLITLRAAQLLAINTSVLLNSIECDDDITIAIDGSVYKHHPRLRNWISEFTSLWAPTIKSHFSLVEDGSGKGAALVAAIASKLKHII